MCDALSPSFVAVVMSRPCGVMHRVGRNSPISGGGVQAVEPLLSLLARRRLSNGYVPQGPLAWERWGLGARSYGPRRPGVLAGSR